MGCNLKNQSPFYRFPRRDVQEALSDLITPLSSVYLTLLFFDDQLHELGLVPAEVWVHIHSFERVGPELGLALEPVELQMAQKGLIELLLEIIGQHVFFEHLLVLDEDTSQVLGPVDGRFVCIVV